MPRLGRPEARIRIGTPNQSTKKPRNNCRGVHRLSLSAEWGDASLQAQEARFQRSMPGGNQPRPIWPRMP